MAYRIIKDPAATGTTQKPSTGIAYPEDYDDLPELVLVACDTTTGWQGNNLLENPTLDTTDFDTGSNSVRVKFDVEQDAISNAYYNLPTADDAGNYRYLAFNVGISKTANEDFGEGNHSGKFPYTEDDYQTLLGFDIVIASDADLGTIHTRLPLKVMHVLDSFKRFYLELEGKTIGSVGVEQVRPLTGAPLNNNYIAFNFDEVKYMAATEAQVAGEAVKASDTNGTVIVGPNDTITGNEKDYGNIGSTRGLLDLKTPAFRQLHGIKSLRSELGAYWEDGSEDMWEPLSQFVANLSDGDMVEGTPGAQYLLDTADKSVLFGEGRNITFVVNGATFFSNTQRTEAMFDFGKRARNITFRDGFLVGPLSQTQSVTVQGDTFTEATASAGGVTTGSNNSILGITGSEVKHQIATEHLARDKDGWITYTVNMSYDSGTGSAADVALTFRDVNETEIPGRYTVSRSGGNAEHHAYFPLTSSETTYTVKFDPQEDWHHIYMHIRKYDSSGTDVLVHEATANGDIPTSTGDEGHALDVLGAQHTHLYNLKIEGFDGDGVHVGGNAFGTHGDKLVIARVGRQGWSQVADYDTILENSLINGAGRATIDIEPTGGSNLTVNPVIHDVTVMNNYLGALTSSGGAVLDAVINPHYYNITFARVAQVSNVAIFHGGTNGHFHDYSVQKAHNRSTGAEVQNIDFVIHGTNMNIHGIKVHPDQTGLRVEDNNSDGTGAGVTWVNDVQAAFLRLEGPNIHVGNFYGGLNHTTTSPTDMANTRFPLGPRVYDLSQTDIHIQSYHAGPIGNDQHQHNHGGKVMGMPIRYIGGDDKFDESLINVGGATSGSVPRHNYSGMESGIAQDDADTKVTITFPTKSDISSNDNDAQGAPTIADAGPDSTSLSATTYYYRFAEKHPRGGPVAGTVYSEASLTVDAGDRIDITWPDLNHRHRAAGAYDYYVREFVIWRGTSSNNPTHWCEVILDPASQLARWLGRPDSGNSHTQSIVLKDDGVNLTITGTDNDDFAGYPSAGVFAWQSTGIPTYTVNNTGMEPDTNYFIKGSPDKDIGNWYVDNYTRFGFDLTWETSAATTFNFGWELVGY